LPRKYSLFRCKRFVNIHLPLISACSKKHLGLNRTNHTVFQTSGCYYTFNYENNQQDALYRLIYYSMSALHVSGDVFAHHQEHLTVFTVSGSVHPRCCQLMSRMSWKCFAPDDGQKHRPKHVEPSWNNKLIYTVHLVCYFHSCITMHGFMNVKYLYKLFSVNKLIPRYARLSAVTSLRAI
jgi:hypothetical protein